MRLIETTVKNYRCLRNATVRFAPQLTVIEGPNEAGKSTLFEAIHRALFLRSTISGQVLEGMRSDAGGHPEVEVRFETGTGVFVVKKQFLGSKGTTTLTLPGGKVLAADPAETRLAEILGVPTMIGGQGATGALEKRWAHIWIGQGRSGREPTGEVGEVSQALGERLQTMGTGGAIQSNLDRRIRNRIQKTVEELLQTSGVVPRANTPWAELLRQVECLKKEEEDLAAKTRSLEDALQQEQRADRRLVELGPLIDQALARRKEAMVRREKVINVRSQLGEISSQIRLKQHEHGQTVKHLAEIAEAEAEIPQLEKRQAEAAAVAAEAQRALQLIDQQKLEAQAAVHQVEVMLDSMRARRDYALAQEVLQRALSEVARWERTATELIEARNRLAGRRAQLSSLPDLNSAVLAEMEELGKRVLEAEAAERALATRVRVLQGCSGLMVAGQEVKERDELRFSGRFEIQMPGVFHLELTPGGGDTLEKAVAAKERALSDLREKLESYGVNSLESARQAHIQRTVAVQEMEKEEEQLRAKGAEEVEANLAKAKDEIARARARMEALQATVQEAGEGPVDDAAWAQAEALLQQRKAEGQALQDQRAEVSERCRLEEANLQEVTDRLRTAVIRRETLVSTSGPKEDLERRRAELEREMAVLACQDAAYREELQELGAEGIEDQLRKLDQEVETLQQEAQMFQVERAKARAVLDQNVGSDPFSGLIAVQEERALAEKMLQAEEIRVRGWQRLLELFKQEEARLEEQFTEPLVRCVAGYLEPIFGEGSKVEASYRDGQFQSLVLNRAALNCGTYPFEKLSVGAREQLGVAFRLAVAEILAERHDGCLPVVLDDAFVNSDPKRMKGLLSMINRATERGLQVILASCSPEDYRGLSAAKVKLG